MTITGALLRQALDWFLPPLCVSCGLSPPGGIDAFSLCGDCRRQVSRLEGRRCPGCLAPVRDPSAAGDFPCGACRKRPLAFDRLLAGWSYETAVRDVVRALKFRRLDYLADALGADLASRFADTIDDCHAVTPVPLHWRRSLRRGYNQAELIAREIADLRHLPVRRRLVRTRATRPQTGLDRARRRRNLRGAFGWRGQPVRGRPHWLLIDDVITTGATLDSAARTLKRAGVGEVTALVVAATPADPSSAPGIPLPAPRLEAP